MSRTRFGRWTGTQQPFPIDVDADDVLEAVADDLLAGMDPSSALRDLLRRGLRGRVTGLGDLRRRVERAAARERQRMGVEGPLRQLAEQLEQIVARERLAAEFDAREDAQLRRDALADLPEDPAAQVRALQEYPYPGARPSDWSDPQAGADFQRLVEQLQREVAQATFGRLASSLGSLSPDDVARMRDALAELNQMLADRAAGRDTAEAFASFKQRYPDIAGDAETPGGRGGGPRSLDELLEELARRMAAMSSLMAGLSPEQRDQLAQIAADVLGDLDLAFEVSQLQRALEDQFPELGWGGMRDAPESGLEDGSLSDTIDWMQRLQEYEDLQQALGQDYAGARLEDVDEDALRRALGDDAVDDLRALREIEQMLERSGAATLAGGRLELTPRGIRRLGERSLARIYERALGGGVGSHRTAATGGDGELTGTTRPWQHGDPFRLDVTRTIGNAVVRGGREPGAAPGERGRVRLAASDFELAESERRVRAVTVLLLDMSFSMPLRGNWVPAKRVALALQALVASKFPEDRFHVVGFSDYARRLQPRDLLATGWERVYGTNMQHAFSLARRIFGAHPGADKHVIMVTDGEPTAHLEGGEAWFNWPPLPETLHKTLQEAARLARTGATLNVFLLDHDPGAAAFVERMVRTYGGRIFYPDLEDLGSVVVRDFLAGRRAGRNVSAT